MKFQINIIEALSKIRDLLKRIIPCILKVNVLVGVFYLVYILSFFTDNKLLLSKEMSTIIHRNCYHFLRNQWSCTTINIFYNNDYVCIRTKDVGNFIVYDRQVTWVISFIPITTLKRYSGLVVYKCISKRWTNIFS